MIKIWDILFNRRRYKEIVGTYEDIRHRCPEGLRLFLSNRHSSDDGSYSIKRLLHTNENKIRQLQADHERQQEILKRSELIKQKYPCGFDFYCFLEDLERERNLEHERLKPFFSLRSSIIRVPRSFVPTPQQILDDIGKILDYDASIHSVKRLKEDCPEGFASCAAANKLNPSCALDPPYDYQTYRLISFMMGKPGEVMQHQRVHNLCSGYPNGFRLVIDSQNNGNYGYIDGKSEEIKKADFNYQELKSLWETYPEMVARIIVNLSGSTVSGIENLGLELIRQVLVFKNFLLAKDIADTDLYSALGSNQRKYIQGLPSLDQQKIFLLNRHFSSGIKALESQEPEDCSSVVPELLKDGCQAMVSTEGVSYRTYFSTLCRLREAGHDIQSATTLISDYRHVVEMFYGLEENATLPFSALTDVYQDQGLSARIDKEATFRRNVSKAGSILRNYPSGYKRLIAAGLIRNISNIEDASPKELGWIIANESLFQSEQKAKEQEERLDQARWIIFYNAEAVSHLFPGINRNSLTPSDADTMIRNKSILENLTRFLNPVSDWDKVKGIPHYFFYWYYPKKFHDITAASENARRLVWDFKDGFSKAHVCSIVKEKLRSTFGSDCSELTFVCIPASSAHKNENRYKAFSEDVCRELGMTSAFDKIKVIRDAVPHHLGGDGAAEYAIEHTFFSGKKVVLFDDVVTTGRSVKCFKDILESYGATVICALSIGRTYSDRNDMQPHPWTGKM